MKRKITSILLCGAMMISLLAGCGGSDSQQNSDGANNNDTQQSAQAGENTGEADGEAYHMVLEVITYGYDDPDLQLVQDAVNEITVPEIGVEVEFLTVPIADMATKLGLLVSGGEQIDLVCAGLLTTPANLVADGLLQPITEYVQASELLNSLSEGIIEACTINGEIYAYPGNVAPAADVRFFYDADLAEQYNITVPEKLDTDEAWEELFAQIKASGMEQYAITLGNGQAGEPNVNYTFDALGDDTYCAYGVVMDMLNGTTVENLYATEEYAQKCELHRRWFEEGYCVPDSISNNYNTVDSMSQGMVFGFISQGGVSMSDAYFSGTTGKNIASVPLGDRVIKASNVTKFCWGVSSSCERPDKAVEFLELIYANTDLANLLNYGIEGTHYVTTEGSSIISYPEGVDSSTCGYGAFVASYGNSAEIYQRQPLTDEFVATIPDYMYETSTASKFLGYTFDPSNVTTEVTAVTAVIQQYGYPLECGTVDPETTIPEFLEALEAAGMSKIVEENQAQLDAWLAAQ